jgi:SAM-dependent methyltransferase
MSDDAFSADWLTLREPADHRARASALLPLLRGAWEARGWSRVLDLGSGTGSNLRYLAPRLPGNQHWTLLDHDPALLDCVEGRGIPAGSASGGAIEVLRRVGDLLEMGEIALEDADLVTASALLDLVSEGWLSTWVRRITQHGCGALWALSYDGSVEWLGREDPDDAWVLEQVNLHQRGEKGMGQALGPDAPERARALFDAAGYVTWVLPSPWILGPEDTALALALLEGWIGAAEEVVPRESVRIRAWGARRTENLRTGEVQVRVGHLDLLALPPGVQAS